MTNDTDTPDDDSTDTLDALEATLRDAVGRDNAITAGALAARHVPDDGDGNPKTRELVKDGLMRERGLPVASCNDGYFIPRDPAVVEQELDSLRGRIGGIKERMAILERNWRDWSLAADGGEVVDEFSPDIDTDDDAGKRQAWSEMDEAAREQVREDPVLEPADFQRGDGDV
jgi:hypothetical protein